MLLVLGEGSLLHLEGEPTIAGVFFGTGIGADVLLHGKPYRLDHSSFELGHIPLHPDGRLCPCGRKGCYEAYSNGHLLVHLAQSSGTPIGNLFTEHWNSHDEVSKELHDVVAVQAMAVETLSVLFSPSYCIIGGGIVDMAGYPKAYLLSHIKAFLGTRPPQWVWASLGDHGSIRGGLRTWEMRSVGSPVSISTAALETDSDADRTADSIDVHAHPDAVQPQFHRT
jgi:allose kinase